MEDSTESSSNPISQGCGQHSQISIQISPTTGGDFSLTVEPNITVENLKKLVSKKLKLPRDRICLLFRDKCVFLFLYSNIYCLIKYLVYRTFIIDHVYVSDNCKKVL